MLRKLIIMVIIVIGNSLFSGKAESVAGLICQDTTWSGTVHVTGDVTVKASPGIGTCPSVSVAKLTISAGAQVRFDGNTKLIIGEDLIITANAALSVQGTSKNPVTFQLFTSSPLWNGIDLKNSTDDNNTSITFATIKEATTGLLMESASPTVTFTSFQYNSNEGIRLTNNSAPNLSYDSFLGNGAGVVNAMSSPVRARFCWWNSSSGPSGAGGGSGQSVSTLVDFEPWLKTSPPVSTAYFIAQAFSIQNRSFNPDINFLVTLGFQTSGTSATWQVSIRNTSEALVKTYSGSGTTASGVKWDGTGTPNGPPSQPQPNGTYYYDLSATVNGTTATVARGVTILDRTIPLTINGFQTTYGYISPNNDLVQDSTAFAATITAGSTPFRAPWTLTVKNSSGTTVYTSNGNSSDICSTQCPVWAPLVGTHEGSFSATLQVTSGSVTTTKQLDSGIVVDTTFPVAQITSPPHSASAFLLSNVYQNGSATVPVVGNVGDTNLFKWQVFYDTNFLAEGSAPVQAATIMNWNTLGFLNGSGSLRLEVSDRAGNKSTDSISVKIGNFRLEIDGSKQADRATAQNVAFKSTIPFQIFESIYIRRCPACAWDVTLFSGPRDEGVYYNNWNGLGSTNYPDGGYFYSAAYGQLPNLQSWDETDQPVAFTLGNAFTPAFDIFNNMPAQIPYEFPDPRKVTITISNSVTGCSDPNVPECSGSEEQHILVDVGCGLPNNYCPVQGEYQESGAHTYYWGGLDQLGSVRTDFVGQFVQGTNMEKNGFVLYGTKPVINQFSVTPSLFYPGSAPLNITFTLKALDSLTSYITLVVQFTNVESHSVLHTIQTVVQKPQSGWGNGQNVAITWDGMSDAGLKVAPGIYSVGLTASDALEQSVSRQVLTTIEY